MWWNMVNLSSSEFVYRSVDLAKRPLEEHEVMVRLNQSFHRSWFLVLSVILLPFGLLYPLSVVIVFLLLYGILFKFTSKTISQETVLILWGFGVQLQTRYVGGRVIRRFIPMDQILKPVLVERVTPVTCYWSLSLVLRQRHELAPVFLTRPPLMILVHIWKALCEATNTEESSNTFTLSDEMSLPSESSFVAETSVPRRSIEAEIG